MIKRRKDKSMVIVQAIENVVQPTWAGCDIPVHDLKQLRIIIIATLILNLIVCLHKYKTLLT